MKISSKTTVTVISMHKSAVTQLVTNGRHLNGISHPFFAQEGAVDVDPKRSECVKLSS